jgi:hypothetical protein
VGAERSILNKILLNLYEKWVMLSEIDRHLDGIFEAIERRISGFENKKCAV